MSGMVGIHQFSRIGTMALVSGGAMVPMDIPPYCIAQGERARLVGLNIIGMRRNGLDRSTMLEIKRAFKLLFRSGKRLEEAMAQLQAAPHGPEVQHMLDFCRASQRGVLAAKKSMREAADE